MRRYLFFPLILLLAGCTGFLKGEPETKAEAFQSIGTACIAATGAVNVLTPMKARGSLSTRQERIIDDALMIVNPICSSGDIPSYSYAIQSLNTQIWVLNGIIFDATGGQ